MSKMLEDLYLGNLSPVDFPHTKTEEHRQKSKQYERESEAFRKTLRELNLIDTFDALLNQYACLNFFDNCEAFQDGFCLGIRLMQEVALRGAKT